MRAPEQSRSSLSPWWVLALWLAVGLGACAGPEPEALCEGGPCGAAEAPCSEGQRRCLGNAPQTCIADGLWGEPRPCDGICRNGSCELDCPADACLVGEARCALGEIQRCEAAADGCGRWAAAQACPAGESCADGACRGDCRLSCTPGDRRCLDTAAVSTCAASAPCPAFGPPEPCPAGTACSDGACRPPEDCVDACPADGRVVCLDGPDGQAAQTCQLGPTGCREWGPARPCGPREACTPGAGCGAACADACQAGELRCAQGGLQRCVQGPAGCLAWGAIEDCGPGLTCADGRCEDPCPESCPVGARRCSPEQDAERQRWMYDRQICEASGGCPRWVADPCPGGAACVGAGQCGDCAPGAQESEACGNCGSRTRTCDASGRWGAFGACGGQGACRADAVEACGNCGQRTCNSRCQWGACEGQGQCAAGSQGECGECGQRTCDAQCRWGDCNNGSGMLFRRCNDCGWQFCCPRGDWCDCAPRYDCPAGRSCQGAGVCR